MKCKHCGKELIAVTMYIEAGAFNVAAQPAGWQPFMTDAGWVNPAPAAAAPCVPSFANIFCSHEPAIEPPNTAGGNYE